MKYYYEHQVSLTGAKFIRVERQARNPLPGRSFVTIAYYMMPSGETVGVVS